MANEMSGLNISINIDEKLIDEKLREIRSVSFSSSLDALKNQAVEIRKDGKRSPSFLLDDKLIAYSFANEIKVRTPRIIQADVSIDEVRFSPGTVVKPVDDNSAKGVFIIKDDGKPLYLNKGTIFEDEESAKLHAKDMMNQKVLQSRRWQSEELIYDANGGIARDVKFYMFYGVVGLVLETKREPKIQRCWYDSDGNVVNTGKYKNELFKGNGGYGGAEAVAKKISLEIPSPFCRIDLLLRGEEIFFGEVTPLPGDYHLFNNEWDKKLGPYMMKAAVRLGHDVGNGKIFEAFNSFERNRSVIVKMINENAVAQSAVS